MKIGAVGSELFRVDRQDKGNSRFSQFCDRAYRKKIIITTTTTTTTTRKLQSN